MRNQNKLIETNKGFGFDSSHFAFEVEVFEPNAWQPVTSGQLKRFLWRFDYNMCVCLVIFCSLIHRHSIVLEYNFIWLYFEKKRLINLFIGILSSIHVIQSITNRLASWNQTKKKMIDWSYGRIFGNQINWILDKKNHYWWRIGYCFIGYSDQSVSA